MQTLQQRDPDLSVIIPVYNLERFLAPMLDTLKAQKLGDYQVEIIFVLNNCTDHSEDVIRASGLDCQVISCSIQGCGPARNEAMDIARGRWIWFMDGDDWLMADTAIKDALDLCTAEDLELLRIPFASNRFNYQYFSMVWQYVMRRDYIDEFRFPAIQPAEDDAFMDAVLNKAGLNRWTYLYLLPHLPYAAYYYNYLREGSNMYRVTMLGEKI